jgi:hypothetical protein
MRLQKIFIPGYTKRLDDSIKNDTWFFPLVILYGQLGEYPLLFGSILLSLKSTLKPSERQKEFQLIYESENSTQNYEEGSEEALKRKETLGSYRKII